MDSHRGIVPPHLLRRIASLEDDRFSTAVVAARNALAERTEHHYHPNAVPPAPAGPGLERRVHDAQHTNSLPRRLYPAARDPATGGVAAA